jgi:hypothetical protein
MTKPVARRIGDWEFRSGKVRGVAGADDRRKKVLEIMEGGKGFKIVAQRPIASKW